MQARRQFLKSSLGALAAGATSLKAAADADVSTLADVAAGFQDFVTGRMMDSDGLCRSMLHQDTLKPWTKEQLAKLDQAMVTDWFKNTHD
ncbi:MAG: hypothetical protein U0984_07785, partial [Prosthecobacter sp.]|nr:hypothetical protein [Prosthecobacter sp.]